jgi:hypothetical protein
MSVPYRKPRSYVNTVYEANPIFLILVLGAGQVPGSASPRPATVDPYQLLSFTAAAP